MSVAKLVDAAELDALLGHLSSEGNRVFLFDGSAVHDKESLFAQAPTGLPFPPGVTVRSWSGFEDYLWQGVVTAGAPQVAVVWVHAEQMLEGGLAVLLEALDVFSSVARLAADAEIASLPEPIELAVYLIGSGPNFGGGATA